MPGQTRGASHPGAPPGTGARRVPALRACGAVRGARAAVLTRTRSLSLSLSLTLTLTLTLALTLILTLPLTLTLTLTLNPTPTRYNFIVGTPVLLILILYTVPAITTVDSAHP